MPASLATADPPPPNRSRHRWPPLTHRLPTPQIERRLFKNLYTVIISLMSEILDETSFSMFASEVLLSEFVRARHI